MNIYEVTRGGVGACVNALFQSTPGECCVLSFCSSLLLRGGGLQGESSYMSPDGQCPLRVVVPCLIRLKYGLLHGVHRYMELGMAVWLGCLV